MPQSFVHLPLHVIFSTKHREAMITHDTRTRLFGYIAGIAKESGCEPMIVNGMADHVHILMGLSSDRSVSEVLRLIKTNSSKWVHEMFPTKRRFAWQNGYAAFAVSASNVESVHRYIRDQEIHHRNRTCAEEYDALLAMHGFVQHPKDLAA